MADADEFGVFTNGLSKSVDNCISVKLTSRDRHDVELCSVRFREILPSEQATAMLLIGRQDAVAGLEPQALSDGVHTVCRAIGDNDLIEAAAEKPRGDGPRLFR